MNLKADDYLINGLLVYSEGDTPIVLITQRGAAKRMLAQEINQLGRAKRGLMVLRELKKILIASSIWAVGKSATASDESKRTIL